MSTPTTIEEWLARFDLSRFATTFRDNGIDLDVLARLGDDDLRELGLSIGDRKRVLAAVSASTAAAKTSGGPSKSGAPWPRFTALCCRARLLISTKTVVPNPATRRDITDISSVSPKRFFTGITKISLRFQQ